MTPGKEIGFFVGMAAASGGLIVTSELLQTFPHLYWLLLPHIGKGLADVVFGQFGDLFAPMFPVAIWGVNASLLRMRGNNPYWAEAIGIGTGLIMSAFAVYGETASLFKPAVECSTNFSACQGDTSDVIAFSAPLIGGAIWAGRIITNHLGHGLKRFNALRQGRMGIE